MAGKCPKCGNLVETVNSSPVTIQVGDSSFKGATYQCANWVCQAVLGCELDPIVLKHDIVNQVVAQVKALLGR